MKIFHFLKTPLVLSTFMFVLFSVSSFGQTTYNINNPEELEDQNYVAGDIIILANGVYDSDERIDFIGNGTADQPIVFRAENPGGVVFTGGLAMDIGGDYVVVDGFHWKGGYGASNFIQFRNGTDYANNSIIQNCVIDGLSRSPEEIAEDIANNASTKHRWIVLYGYNNTVTNCSFMNKTNAGALILSEAQYNGENDPCTPVGHIVSNNYFYKYAKTESSLSNANDSETIRIGSSGDQNVQSNMNVFNNYFVESDGENEIISNKTKGNVFTNNTFRRCRGSLVMRHGSNATVEGNYFLGENVDGTGGVRVIDSHHNITNNYIQDCITILSQTKWNNGITFMGGGDNYATDCTSTDLTNGYQKSENVNISNNTIVNTNAPLFYNADKGTTDPTGTIANNLIFFAEANVNISDVISGDTENSYEDLGTTLNYTGNVYKGAELGKTNDGFQLESDIEAIIEGEIFTFTGAGSEGKGADMGAYKPTTDDMVGYGIGACFLDYQGEHINDGTCEIAVGEYMTISSVGIFPPTLSSADVSVVSNVDWTAESNNSWISLDMNSGMGNSTVSVIVEANPDTSPRTGTVTFSQVSGDEDITRTLTVNQQEADLTDLYKLINVGTGAPGDLVTLHSFSKEEVNGDNKFNYAKNTLDKDNGTVWAADDGDVVEGDYKGDGEYIIYDLGMEHTINLIRFTTTNKSDPFGFQLWASTGGTDPSDFEMILPTTGDLLLTKSNTTDFNLYQVNGIPARYIKIIGYGRFNSAGDSRTSVWSAVGEIEFYGDELIFSVEEDKEQTVFLYPIPAMDILHIEWIHEVDYVSIYQLDGRKIMGKVIEASSSEIELDISSIPAGSYTVVIEGNGRKEAKLVVVAR